MIKRKILSLSPLLAIYIVIIVLLNNPLEGDELRYMAYAENLTQGFYTSPDNPDLSNGPGYPLVLLPFVALDVNLMIPNIINGIFVFLGILFFYKSLRLYLKPKIALISSYVLGLYPPLLHFMPDLLSESLSFFLINGFIFHFCSFHLKKNNPKNGVLASLFLGFLVLTKVIFFHVVVVSMTMLVLMSVFKKSQRPKWSLLILTVGILFTTPFLVYAYKVTNKPFYLGTRGGELLYHRSTPFENEYGNWFSADRILGVRFEGDSEEYQRLEKLRLNHGEFYQRLQPLSNMERDSALKVKAIENMKKYPIKYLKNTMASTGRLFFNIPNSYKNQGLQTYGYLIPNGIILVFLVLIARTAILERSRIPFEIKSVVIFVLIYGFGIILLLGKPRYFIMMVPGLILFLVYSYSKLLKINLLKKEKKSV